MGAVLLRLGLCAQALMAAAFLFGWMPDYSLPSEGQSLKVLTLKGQTTWQVDRDGVAFGPEVTLVEEFARFNGWEVDWLVVDSREELFSSLQKGQAHLAAAGLTLLASRRDAFLMGSGHTEVDENVVCHFGLKKFPKNLDQLTAFEIAVEESSSFLETLRSVELKEGIRFDLDIRDDSNTEDLLREVSEEDVECAIADSNQIKAYQRLHPDLKVAMTLKKGQQLGWYLPKQGEEMQLRVQHWMGSKAGKRTLTRVKNNYFDYISEFDFFEMQVLNRRIKERLPKYKDLFIEAEEETGLPADLLAAVAYQESHWNPTARSPTGVRGMMMLTQRTAKSLGVSNRLDPESSIKGGARYLKDRYEQLPDSIDDPDRLFFALASYNVGSAHVDDARKLASKMGKDPDSWTDLRKVLPLKADRRYYSKMRYGYARGHEPVRYVRRIRNYRDVIRTAFH